MNYWLFKSEPDAFSIDDLDSCRGKRESWDGIRNYQARNLMRDEMKKSDLGFFYHSSCKVPGIVGIVEVVREAYPDHTALDPDSRYHDPKATEEDPRWCMVDVRLVQRFAEVISLRQLREEPALDGMMLLKKGARLSIQPVSEAHWHVILEMAGV
ncbi:MAG: EVE domain-containing protein [Gammaproteobacteria bacterium]|nr:MAG: EVE domain-containing protein [Gammaproteobacteria bacterium]